MHYNTKELQLQYQGFCESNLLWINTLNKKLQQIDNHSNYTNLFKLKINTKLRLGKLVEQFVFNELLFDSSIKIIIENLQIQDDKITVGELDCILTKDERIIHLEIVYKFYLYDASAGKSEMERWIGPNRRDSFYEKYEKLVHKQLPLLYHPKTKEVLETYNLPVKNIEQRVYFKAQLFPHISEIDNKFPLINNECIEGFYIYEKELNQFMNCKFYIPSKPNWLVKPHANVEWLPYESYTSFLSEYLEQKNAPLCWLKKPNGVISKFFVVWWQH